MSDTEDTMPAQSILVQVNRLLIVVALFAISAAAFGQSPQAYAKQVTSGVEAVNGRTTTYFAPVGQRWHKQTISIREVKYDVKRTDSALTPLVGVLEATVVLLRSDGHDTQEQAANAPVAPGSYYHVNATFIPSEAPPHKWTLKSGTAVLYSQNGLELATFPLRGSGNIPYELLISAIMN